MKGEPVDELRHVGSLVAGVEAGGVAAKRAPGIDSGVRERDDDPKERELPRRIAASAS